MINHWRNLSSVLTGSIFAQMVSILGSLILARQFAPGEFGIYSVWLGGVTFISVCLTGRLEMSLPSNKDGADNQLAVIKIISTILIFAFIGCLIAVFANLSSIACFHLISIEMLIISFISSVLTSFLLVWQAWLAAEGFFTKLSLVRIFQNVAIILFQVIFGIFYQKSFTLISGHFAGLILSALFCTFIFPISLRINQLNFRNDLLSYWKKNKNFLLFSLPADAINTAAGQLPLFLIANKFGADIAGFLALTLRILGSPVALISSSVSDVFKRHAASAFRNRGECKIEYLHTFKILFFAAVISVPLFFIFAKPLILQFYGKNWLISGQIAIWLIPMLVFRLIASPLSYMVYISGKQNIDLLWQISLLLVTILSLNLSTNYEIALKAYSYGYALLYIVYIVITFRLSLGNLINHRDHNSY